MTVDYKTLAKGDIIRITRTFKIDQPTESLWGPVIRDVKTGASSYLAVVCPDDEQIELVQKAKPPVRKVQAGDVVTSGELQEIRWKRGTIIKHPDIKNYSGFVLMGDGLWHMLDAASSDFACAFPFRAFTSPEGYELVFVAR